jgi:cellulose synthase/poly-beta-1,6-N-acetylglucosamine synthase-like glycosyltransferase
MQAFLVVYAAVGAVVLALHAVLSLGIILNFLRDAALGRAERAGGRGSGGTPRGAWSAADAEVIVAVRNEERSLPALLSSLSRQEGCSFLFVDDRSTDSTGRMLEGFCAAMGGRARVIHNTHEPEGLTGKQAALDAAFKVSRGELLFFTDGDCVVPEGWVSGLLRYFRDPRVGAVLARVELEGGSSFLSSFQSFEQPLINQYNFGNVGVGTPMGCFGNNMALRAEVIRELGGFESLGYSVTEDAALIAAVGRRTRWRVRVATGMGTATVTRPKPSWREYLGQHVRWNAGAFFARDPGTRLAYGFVVGYLILCLLLLPLGFLDLRITLLSLNAFLSIGLLGILNGAYPGKRPGSYFLLFLPYLAFFAFFYTVVSLRALTRRPLEWKGATLRPSR